MNDDWKVVSIDDALIRVKKPVDVKSSNLYQQIGIRSHGKGIFHKEEVTGESLGNKRVFWIEPDCFVVNIVFAWEQAVAKTTQDEVGLIASHRFPMYKPKKEILDLDFLLNFFKTKKGKHILGLASPGGAGRNKTLGQAEFARLKLTLPPIREQKKITHIISTWDEAIGKLELLITTKQKRKRALMQQLLTGKKRFIDTKNIKEFSVRKGFFQSKLGYLPNDWIVEKLPKVLFFQEGPGVRKHQFTTEGVKLLNGSNIQNAHLDLGNTTRHVSEEEAYGKYKHFLADSGDLVIASSGIAVDKFEDKIAFVKETDIPLCMNTSTIRFKVTDSTMLDINYFKYYMMTNLFKNQIRRQITGSAQLNFGPSHLKEIFVVLPSIEEQQKIAQVLTTADSEISTHQTQLKNLKEQKRGLMQQLLTGKTRVKVDA